MKQQEVRERLNTYIESSGIIAKRICLICKIPEYTLSRFRRGKQDLYEDSLEVLDHYLKEHE